MYMARAVVVTAKQPAAAAIPSPSRHLEAVTLVVFGSYEDRVAHLTRPLAMPVPN